jgi:hypothetical protein
MNKDLLDIVLIIVSSGVTTLIFTFNLSSTISKREQALKSLVIEECYKITLRVIELEKLATVSKVEQEHYTSNHERDVLGLTARMNSNFKRITAQLLAINKCLEGKCIIPQDYPTFGGEE